MLTLIYKCAKFLGFHCLNTSFHWVKMPNVTAFFGRSLQTYPSFYSPVYVVVMLFFPIPDHNVFFSASASLYVVNITYLCIQARVLATHTKSM